ncbi:unnamed protein product [Cunninghamella echinulata]
MTPPRRSTRIKKEITTTYPMVVLNPTTVLKKRKASSRSFSTFTTKNSESESDSSDLEEATEQEVKDNNSDDDNDNFQPVIKFTTRRKQRISATPAKKIKIENDVINFSTFSSSTSTPALSIESSSTTSSSTVTTPPDHDNLIWIQQLQPTMINLKNAKLVRNVVQKKPFLNAKHVHPQ